MRSRLMVAGTLSFALTSSLLAVPVAGAERATAVPVEIAAATAADSFWDVPSSYSFYHEIDWLVRENIATGYSDGSFQPVASVSRQAMAAFLYRFAGRPAYTPPPTSPFADVPPTHSFYREIAWMYENGLSSGTVSGGSRYFYPTSAISRWATAAFLYRMADEPAVDAASVTPFVDVPPSHPGFVPVTWMIQNGIATGSAAPGGASFRPGDAVSRQAMAAFLYRSANQDQSGAVGAPSLAATSDLVAQRAGSTNGLVYLSAPGHELSYAVASANAAQTGGVALSAVASGTQSVVQQLTASGAVTVELVGPPGGFGADLRSALQSIFDVTDRQVGALAADWSLAMEEPHYRQEVVVADLNEEGAAALAASVAITTGAALVLVGDGGTASSGASLASDPAVTRLTLVGEQAIASIGTLSEDSGATVVRYSLGDPGQVWLDAAFNLLPFGYSARRIVVSSSDSVADQAAAATVARSISGLPFSQPAAEVYAELVAERITTVLAVGRGAGAILPETYQEEPGDSDAVGWAVSDVVLQDGAFTISFPALQGAARYRAYGADGAELATSASSRLTISGPPQAVAIFAEAASGAVISSLQFKVNSYVAASDRESVVAGSQVGTRATLAFLGRSGVPRLVTRSESSPVADPAVTETAPQRIAVTCSSVFTEVGLDPTVQYQYNAIELSSDRSSCDRLGLSATSTMPVGGVAFPATAGFAATSVAGAAGGVESLVHRAATRSVLQQAVPLGASASDGSATMMAPGDDWPAITFRYQAFIAMEKIWAPGATGTVLRPYQFFGGDGRLFDPKGTFRYRQDATVYFGVRHDVLYAEDMGETHKYACRWPNGTDCVHQQSDTAAMTGLGFVENKTGPTGAAFELYASAGNPLHRLAPPIDARLAFKLSSNGSVIRGSHDNMPTHEVWFLVEGWDEWLLAYGSTTFNPACLAGQLPKCTLDVNVAL